MVKLINCCKHDVNVKTMGGLVVTFPGTSRPARIVQIYDRAAPLRTTRGVIETTIKMSDDQIKDMPVPKYNTLYIVSRIVFENSDRRDLVTPVTGYSAVRGDYDNEIKYVTRLLTKIGGLSI